MKIEVRLVFSVLVTYSQCHIVTLHSAICSMPWAWAKMLAK